MKKLAMLLMAVMCVVMISQTVVAEDDYDEPQDECFKKGYHLCWDLKVPVRPEYRRWGLLGKLELTPEQTKLIKTHEKCVQEEFTKGLFSILTKKQIKKREKLIEKREAWHAKKKAELKEQLAKIEDEAEREEAKEKFYEHVEWIEYLRHYFFRQDVEELRKKIKEHLKNNDNDPKPCKAALDKIQKQIDRIRAHYFPYEIRCRLGLTYLQHRMIHERDVVRVKNWVSGLKEILTEEQFEYWEQLVKERAEFYKNQRDKFKKRLEEKFKENGEDWNPFKGNGKAKK